MEILRIADTGYETAASRAAEILDAGGIILYPTDTLYGLGVDAQNKEALLRLYALKKRSIYRTALISVPSLSVMEAYGHVNGMTKSLAKRFLPGALTLVLPAQEGILPEIIRDDGTVGIRMPNDTFCLALNRAFGAPYTSTSANLSDMPTHATIEEIVAQFGDAAEAINLVIDDGPRAGGKPSTIVSCVNEKPRLLREGAVSEEEIFS